MFSRTITSKIAQTLSNGKSVLIFGARQTGKTTLAKMLSPDYSISLLSPKLRQAYSANPDSLTQEVKGLKQTNNTPPLILIDEIQKVPALLDVVQYLIDENLGQFILTGSSARKLRISSELNLLPGRVIVYYMDPLTIPECPINSTTIEELLYDGSLPGIMKSASQQDRHETLESYATVYLEEEIRAEALVKNVDSFARFLELAARESGQITNQLKLSQQVGVNHVTIKTYYQILIDSLVAFRIPPFTVSAHRKRLTKSPKIIFFDLGVRRFCAKEGTKQPAEVQGRLFGQFIGLELIRHKHIHKKMMNILYWRDHNGTEVDYVIEIDNMLIPIEVKLTSSPSQKDARHLNVFLSEYSNATKGYIICNCHAPLALSDTITALPWQELASTLTFITGESI